MALQFIQMSIVKALEISATARLAVRAVPLLRGEGVINLTFILITNKRRCIYTLSDVHKYYAYVFFFFDIFLFLSFFLFSTSHRVHLRGADPF